MSLPPPIPPPARPVFVWIICGYYCFTLISAGLSLWLVHSGLLPMPQPQRSYFASLTWVDYTCTAAITAINAGGAVALFFLRRVATYLFAIGLLTSISLLIYQIVAKNYLQAMGPALPGAFVGWAIPVAIIIYARHLTKNGVLR
ncbi:MAG: hypothetical protein ABJF10_08655 [Chthoniobacter sp.]|uniref:hypothetical protein n=1 Tax=Chthoniobacter sp. TaxID=2510640 RepID=UPI0032A61BBC